MRSITDWTSQTTFTTISDVTLFETENEQDLEDLMLIPDFSKQIVRKVGPTAVIVSGDVEELSEKLRKHKCMVRRKLGEEEVTPSADTSVAEQFLLYGEDQGIEDVPDLCDGCPAVQSCNKVIRRRSKGKRGV